MRADEDMVALRTDKSYVVRCLYCILHSVAHLDDPLRYLLQTFHKCLVDLYGNDGILSVSRTDGAVHIGVVGLVFLAQPFVDTLCLCLDKFRSLARRHTNDQIGSRGDGGVGLAHPDAAQAEVTLIVKSRQKGPDRNHSTTATLVDVNT